MSAISTRRMGDQIDIPGDYQYRVSREGWAPQRFWHYAKLIEAERWLSPSPGDVILDVGCGSGVLAARLAEHSGTQVIGIDANPAAIEFANGRFRQSNLEFKLGLVDDLGLPDECVDKIAFLEVIEHIHPDQGLAVLGTFHRLLRSGGRLVISTPNIRSFWPLIEWSLDRLNLVPHMSGEQHVAFYHTRSLTELAERAGFRLIAHRTINGFAPWLSALSWKLAEFVHRLEQSCSHSLGSVLLQTFEKHSS